ncbi:MAG: hypothetical protein ACSHWW_03805 [Nonlabens sp.]|uniref:hypothetical protein n=1 Tax=Nonlabens sp. TaxID=1888209 RepID=UPI003EF22AD0
MKNLFLTLFLSAAFLSHAQVGINTDSPDPSAILDIDSTTLGVKLPHVSITGFEDVTTIPSPAEGLVIYSPVSNTAVPNGIYFFNGTKWNLMGSKEGFDRIIRDEITLANATYTEYNGNDNGYGDYTTLFNGVDETGAATFHFNMNGGNTADWGFGFNWTDNYNITSVTLDGRNGCCTNRIDNVYVEIFNGGTLAYTSSIVGTAVTGDNVIAIPNIEGNEVRLTVANGGNSSATQAVMNFTELKIAGTRI